MNAHVLLNMFHDLRNRDEIKCEACQVFYRFFTTSFINAIIREHEFLDYFYHMAFNLLKIAFLE